jgi:lysophospholipase II
MATSGSTFPPVHIIEPLAGHTHTHTAIMIHGRGSSGPEFAEELFESKLSGGNSSLRSPLPGWRWVFPSSQSLWSSTFQEEFPAWFEAHSLTDVDARQDLQMEGIRQSTKFLARIMDEEIGRLRGARENLFLCGISQGGAIALWTLLCQKLPGGNIGGLVGASCWLPFAEAIRHFLGNVSDPAEKASKSSPEEVEASRFVASMMADAKASLAQRGAAHSLLRTPVFLGHGTDDAYIDVTLGRQVRDILAGVGLMAEWKEYTGADQEGHWFKEPEQLDDIAKFLTEAAKKTAHLADKRQNKEPKVV